MRIFSVAMTMAMLMASTSIGWSQDDPFDDARAAARQASKAAAAITDKARGKSQDAHSEGRKSILSKTLPPSAAEQRIREILDAPTSQSFVETPLNEAMQVLADTHEIPILIDRRALEEIGLDHEVPLTMSLSNVSLRSFLRLVLRDLELTYVIKDEVLQITTVEAAESNLVLEMYVLPEPLAAKSEKVIAVLTATVVPDTWESLGGNSSAMALDHVLVISTTHDVHFQCEEFLQKLIANYGKP